MKKSTLLTLALSAVACVSQAQVATFSDIGATPPTPGPNDISQLSTTGEIQNNAGNNYYFDNTGQPAGTTFTTGANAAGYTVTNVIVACFPGNYGNNGTISAAITNTQPFKINFYVLTGPNATYGLQTNAIFIGSYVSTPGTLVPGDFLQFSGLNVTLPPNTICAFTFGRLTTGFGYIAPPLVPPTGATALYPGGSECIINPGGGANAVNYAATTLVNGIIKTNYSTVFDIGMTLNPSALPAYNVLPSFLSLPLPTKQYPGTTAHFTAQTNSVGAITNGISGGAGLQWQVNTGGGWANLVDGATGTGSSVVGSLTTNLTIANIGASDVGSYQLVFTNSVIGGPVNSTATPAVTLTELSAPTVGSFAAAALALNPVAFWPLNENSQNPGVLGNPNTVNPAVGSALAYDVAGGFTGIYGPAALNGFDGFAGPEAPTYGGFPSVNYSWVGSGNIPNTYVTTTSTPTLPGTNVTIVAWINPLQAEASSTAIIMQRNGWNGATATDGLIYRANQQLGYNWDNNSGTTTGFNSGLIIPQNTWSMVAMVINSNAVVPGSLNSTLYLFNSTSAGSAAQAIVNNNQAWHVSATIGSDAGGNVANNGFGGGRAFVGQIADVLMYTNSLTEANLVALYQAGVPGATLPPVIGSATPSTNLEVYPGVSIALSVPVGTLIGTTSGFQWQKNTGAGWQNLTDGLQGSGSTLTGSSTISTSTGATVNTTLSIANVSSGDAASYQVVITNSPVAGILNTVPGPTITVTVLPAPTANSFAAVALSYSPVAFWPLNETVYPGNLNVPAFDVVGGYNGIYGVNSINGSQGIFGPESPTYSGFPNPNYALETTPGEANTYVTTTATPTLPTNNTNVTMVAWVYPTGNQANAAGIMFDRANGTTTAGIDISVGNQFGWTWDNNLNTTYNYNSGLIVPSNTWNMLACSVSPSNTTFYVGTTNGLFSVVQTLANINQQFGGAIVFGDDPGGAANGGRAFNGEIADCVLYATNLTGNQIGTLFAAGLASGHLLPIIGTQPSSTAVFGGRNATFAVQASGLGATTYQWQVNTGSGYVNVSNGNGISGANTNVLTIGNVGAGNVGSYQVIVTDFLGSVTNTTPATLTLAPNTVYATSTYAEAVTNLNPLAYYRLGEAPGSLFANDFWGGFTATYGTSGDGLGVAGPTLSTFPGGGFEINNQAVDITNSSEYYANTGMPVTLNSQITLPALNLNTNTMTITMWINPTETPLANEALFFSRAAGTVAGLGFNGSGALGYYWNSGTGAFFPGLVPPPGQWSFVALVIAPDHAQLYCYNATSLGQVRNNGANANQSFSGISMIGNDPVDPSGARQFDGDIDEVAIFNKVLTGNQIDALFTTGSGLPVPAAIVATATGPGYVNIGASSVNFGVSVTNGTQFFYNWSLNGLPLTNGNNGIAGTLFSGTNTGTLSISNYLPSLAGETVMVTVSNVASSVLATTNMTTPLVFPVPARWTANFNFTNGGQWTYNNAPPAYPALGFSGNYGIIGQGTYWNPIISPGNTNTLSGNAGGTGNTLYFTNQTALDVNGNPQPGLGNLAMRVGGNPYGSGSTVSELFDIFIQQYQPLTISNVAPGWYNIIFYYQDGVHYAPTSGANISYEGVNLIISNDTVTDFAFELANPAGGNVGNTGILTNVYTLSGNFSFPAGGYNVEDFNGFAIQQVMPISVSVAQTDATHVTVSYSGGSLYTASSIPQAAGPPGAGWTAVGGAPPYSGSVVIPIVSGSEQFFEIVLGDGYPLGGGN